MPEVRLLIDPAGPYRQAHQRSLRDPVAFWEEAARGIHWLEPWRRVMDVSPETGICRWFEGGMLNTCYNALDRHVEAGRGDRTALIYDSAMTGRIERFSFRQLTERTARFAGVLAAHGVERGDRVIIYMPMVPEAVVAILACARIGAVHSVVFGGFAAPELAVRIDDATPKVIVSASCGLEPGRIVPYKPLLDEALSLASHRPECCIVLARPEQPATLGERDIDWQGAEAAASPHPCVPVAATDPLYILYTSGTTGQPKGIVRDQGGHAVALHWSMRHIYDVRPGETYWAASDLGWAVGHSYIVYGPLLAGNATVLFEGKPVGTPDAGTFWRVIAEHDVKVLFTAPTAFRAIKREDPRGELIGRHDLSGFRALFLAGERCDPDTLHWAEDKLGVPVIDHWWQTETGWSICVNCLGVEPLPVKPGSAGPSAPGWDLRVLDPDGAEMPPGEIGALAARLPLPPGTFPTLWNAEERFRATYLADFPGYYHTADAGFIDEDGYVFVMSRTDDIINVAGHRLSTGAMEEVLAAHPEVAECAVVGVADPLKGQIPVGFLVLQSGAQREDAQVVAEVIQQVRQAIGPVAAFKKAAVVPRLPKTRSGKILRGTIRKLADGEPWQMPATIDDPEILDEIAATLARLGYPKDV